MRYIGAQTSAWGQENCFPEVVFVGMCMNLCVCVCVSIYILHFMKVWHRGEVLWVFFGLVFAAAPGFLWGCSLLTVHDTRRFNSAILWVIFQVWKLWQIN